MKKWTVQASNNHQDHKNALILNGDRCLCRKKHDVWYAYGMPWSGSSGEYINRRVPISCIVCLNRGLYNPLDATNLCSSLAR